MRGKGRTGAARTRNARGNSAGKSLLRGMSVSTVEGQRMERASRRKGGIWHAPNLPRDYREIKTLAPTPLFPRILSQHRVTRFSFALHLGPCVACVVATPFSSSQFFPSATLCNQAPSPTPFSFVVRCNLAIFKKNSGT